MKTSIFLIGLLSVVLAGDIPLSSEEREEARKALYSPGLFGGDMKGIVFDAERNVIVGDHFRWPNATVPYVIHHTLSQKEAQDPIKAAFEEYHTKTCVRFVERTDEEDYVELTWIAGDVCNSDVGRITGKQTVNLGTRCWFNGTVIHELGHTLGFYHEHNRSDRDEYLIIYMENVNEGDAFNFNKLSPQQNILYSDYDYDSIMHYGSKSFSKNGEDTMRARNDHTLLEPFEKFGMTKSDIERVKKMYNCS